MQVFWCSGVSRLIDVCGGAPDVVLYGYQRSGVPMRMCGCGAIESTPGVCGASMQRANNVSSTEIREQGRWLSDSSLRVYLDLVGAAQLETNQKLSRYRAHMEAAGKMLLEILSEAVLAQ